jgi:hypothetical protein
MSNVASLTYDAEKHEYRIGGRRVPGVTTLLSLSGYFPSQGHYTAESRRRGTAVHRACYLLDEHCPEATTVDEALEVLDLDERLIPYMQGYLAWKRESGFIPQRHEFQVCSAKLNIASTPDLYGGFTTGSGIYGVVELKTWKAAPPKCQRSAELQTAAQALMIEEHLGLPVERRVVVALTGNPDHPHRAYVCDRPGDKNIVAFLAHVFWDRVNSRLLEWTGEEEEAEE